MLPESDAWSAQQLKENARQLNEALAMRAVEATLPELAGNDEPGSGSVLVRENRPGFVSSLASLIPHIVMDTWGWPVKGPKGLYRQGGVILVEAPTLPNGSFMIASLLEGRAPTIEGLCQLASDAREALRGLGEGNNKAAGPHLIASAIDGKVVRRLGWGITQEQVRRREAPRFMFTDDVEGFDFGTHCFWLLANLLAEGHAWRVTSCEQCKGFFLKTRRDPPERPSRFCSEQCRRDWHNPRRPKKGGGL
jgi:hypothetical protein